MKRIVSLIIIVSMLACSAFAEGLLPQVNDVLGVILPSLSAVLFRNPDSMQTLSDGSQELTYVNVSESEFQDFSIYLQESGCEMLEYNTTTDSFTAIISKDGKAFSFTYDLKDFIATLTYPAGTRVENATQVDIGNIVTFGYYEQDNDLAKGMEPIEWIVLDRQGDELLLISKYILELQKFNNVLDYEANPEKNNWAACDLRAWLNNTFFDKAFAGIQEYLLENKLFTPDVLDSQDETIIHYGGGETLDKVYLLSREEIELLLPDAEDRAALGTAYVTAKLNYGGNLGWYLRSVHKFKGRIDHVEGDNWSYPDKGRPGVISSTFANATYVLDGPKQFTGYNESTESPGIGVRPTIRIRTAGLAAVSGSAEMEAYETLSKGSTGEQVKVLQQALIEQGYLNGKADGDFGNMTVEAVQKAQSAFGMEVTGIADSAFQNELYSK